MAQTSTGKERRSSKPSSSTSSTDSLEELPLTPSNSLPLSEELATLFECPVCLETSLPPIMQCHGGHLVCSSCHPKLSCCPTCRGILGSIRNLAMEKVAKNLTFPCKHKNSGCKFHFGLDEKAEHEEICEFRPYRCPYPGLSCSWEGQLEKVIEHIQQAHVNITTLNGANIVFLATDINLPGSVSWIVMQNCFGRCFMLLLEKQENYGGYTQFNAIVQLIGPRSQAERFIYRLELAANQRRLSWEAVPRSSHDGVETAILSSDCLVFNAGVAQLFAHNNANLSINVTISLAC